MRTSWHLSFKVLISSESKSLSSLLSLYLPNLTPFFVKIAQWSSSIHQSSFCVPQLRLSALGFICWGIRTFQWVDYWFRLSGGMRLSSCDLLSSSCRCCFGTDWCLLWDVQAPVPWAIFIPQGLLSSAVGHCFRVLAHCSQM